MAYDFVPARALHPAMASATALPLPLVPLLQLSMPVPQCSLMVKLTTHKGGSESCQINTTSWQTVFAAFAHTCRRANTRQRATHGTQCLRNRAPACISSILHRFGHCALPHQTTETYTAAQQSQSSKRSRRDSPVARSNTSSPTKAAMNAASIIDPHTPQNKRQRTEVAVAPASRSHKKPKGNLFVRKSSRVPRNKTKVHCRQATALFLCISALALFISLAWLCVIACASVPCAGSV